MCFSAEVSFAAAAGLGVIGIMSIRMAPSRRHVPLAAVPLLFAAQQTSEGMVWRALADAPFGKASPALAQVFLFFALFVWPAFLPVALLAIETRAARKRALAVFAVLGTALGAYLMACSALRPSYACIAYDNLYYAVEVDAPYRPASPFVYVSAIAAPLLVSSLRGAKALAAIALASSLAAGLLYRVGFASVWCFFAAMISGAVALVVKLSGSSSVTGIGRRGGQYHPSA